MNKKIISITLTLTCSILAACAGPSYNAPVVDRLPSRSLDSELTPQGYYTVKPGDTLYSIALDYGLDWRELARANGISSPSSLNIGRKLLVENLPARQASRSPSSSESSSNSIRVRPVPGGSSGGSVRAKPIQTPSESSGASSQPSIGGGSGKFIWPHDGPVIANFKAGVNKGIDLAAKLGDPVRASQGGKVVYSGNALRGYGNLIIIKHDNDLLTAYAHNKTLLVKEGDTVKTAQKIAEAGQSDTDRVKLHFEVRKAGKPVNPMGYLEKR